MLHQLYAQRQPLHGPGLVATLNNPYLIAVAFFGLFGLFCLISLLLEVSAH
jgi:hypothetical protein